ncbi:MAG: nitroreductase family protein [Christensenellaceae bacterium]|jgi:nitroreductase|nr:nitroreductase family protein [Christensenellaceae bacterium]
MNQNPVIQAIQARRSIRGYESRQISPEERQALIEAALAAPTGGNRQAWFFAVCQNKALLDEISLEVKNSILKKPSAKVGEDYSVHFHAPTVVFIAAPAEDKVRGALLDAGIAAENIVIAAQGLGLGNILLGMPREAFNSARGAEFEKRLGFPEGYEFKVAVAVGYGSVTKEKTQAGPNKYAVIE